MSASAKLGGLKSDDKGHRAKVAAKEKMAAKWEKKLSKGQILDPALLAEQQRDGDEQRRAKGFLPTAALFTGKWVRPDKRDTNMQIRRELIKKGPQQGAGGATDFGVMTVNDDLIEYLKGKKEQEENWHQLRLASYLIDPKRPETQDRAFEMFPELKEYPDQYHNDNLAIQETLRLIIRDGKLGGPEDNALIAHIIRGDYNLPVFPVWDPEGLIIKEAVEKTGFLDLLVDYTKRGLFSPRRYGVDFTESEKLQDFQALLKIMILRRIYPGLRSMKMDLNNFKILMAKLSTPAYIGAGGGVLPSQMTEDQIKNLAMKSGVKEFNDAIFPAIP